MWCRAYLPHFINTWPLRTNNHIESFHRVLKYIKVEQRKFRVDELVTLLHTSVSSHYKRMIRLPDLHKLRLVIRGQILRAQKDYVDQGSNIIKLK